MPFRDARRFICAVVTVLLLSGCVPAIRNSVIDVRATIDRSGSDRAYKALTLTLLDQGFDLKMKDTELRIITTEYKKYTSVSGWPPFDFYLQIKAVVRDVPGSSGGEIALWPKVKEQNRLNQNAFTEHPLLVYAPEDGTPSTSARAKAMQEGQRMFQSIVQAVATALGVSAESFKRTIQPIEVLGM